MNFVAVVSCLAVSRLSRPHYELSGIKVQIGAASEGLFGPAKPISFFEIDDYSACEVPHDRQGVEYSVIDTLNHWSV